MDRAIVARLWAAGRGGAAAALVAMGGCGECAAPVEDGGKSAGGGGGGVAAKAATVEAAPTGASQLGAGAASQPSGAAPAASAGAGRLDWSTLERPLLKNHRQLTSRTENRLGPGFVKAGEAYFDHHSPPKYVIFQGVVQPPAGIDAEPYYAMYVARLIWETEEAKTIDRLDEPLRISTEKTANTCGWFHPTIPWRVMYGSTVETPSDDQPAGFQVKSRRYVWMFPKEMDIVVRDLRPVHRELTAPMSTEYPPPPAGYNGRVTRLMEPGRANYDAECSWSKDGRYVLFASVRDEMTRGRPDADIWIYDTQTRKSHEIVRADGYDGGPFFSPDGKKICYRSDRRGDDLLQLYVAELKFDESGVPVGIVREHAITDDQNVNWAPFWHPSGKFLVYGSSAVGHHNYEVFAVEVNMDKPAKELRRRRVTFADGADVLPAFSDDGRHMIWTAQRGPMIEGESKPSSQLWVAEVVSGPGGFDDFEHLFDNLPEQRPEGPPPAPGAAGGGHSGGQHTSSPAESADK